MFRMNPEIREHYRRRDEQIAREGWGLTPALWSVTWQPNFLGGGGQYHVVMNNHQHHASFNAREEAELEAARMNYQRGSYYRPAQYGLDGLG